jgi:hypothetical protein
MHDLTKRSLLKAVSVSIALALGFGAASAQAATLRLQLVNSGPATVFFQDSFPCSIESLPAELSTQPGTSRRQDSPGSATARVGASVFSYTAAGAFIVPAGTDAVVLRLWAFSGDGSCPDQTSDATMSWRLDCSGPKCGSVSLTNGWQDFVIPAGTPQGTLMTEAAANVSADHVGVGDTLTLQLSTPSFAGFSWNAPSGVGDSSVAITTAGRRLPVSLRR